MSMIEALRDVGAVDIPRVRGFHADTIGELYENVISLNRLDYDTMLQWWRMLCDYVTGDGALRVFVRKLERGQRRGFVSCFDDGLSYVFCDNSFAKVIYGLARMPYLPINAADFTEAVNDPQQIKCLQVPHLAENAVDDHGNHYCVYRNNARMPDFHREWKLAHIIGVNQVYGGNYNVFQKRYFQPGELGDWAYDEGYGFIVRNMGNMRSPNDRGFFISHFLRFANPMNFFLIPLHHRVVVKGFARDISEDVNLLEYMRQLRHEEFGNAWEEFERSVRFSGFGVREDRLNLSNKRIDFTCHPVADAAVQRGHRNNDMRGRAGGMVAGANDIAAVHGQMAVEITLNPADATEFKRLLLQTHLARRTRVFADGRPSRVDFWRADSFTVNSNLMGNIKSSAAYRNAVRDGVVRLEFAIVNN